MGKCKRSGCKDWGMGMIMLESTTSILCDDHREEFDADPRAAELCNETIRLKGAEQRALAIVYNDADDTAVRDHEDAIEVLIKHRMACKAFVADFLARPAPEVPEAAK